MSEPNQDLHSIDGGSIEEDEPILKYSRFLDGSLATVTGRDTVSALAICKTLFVIGSHNGIVYIFDIRGTLVKQYRAHSAAIASVSIDREGTTVASGGIDGRVVVYSLVKKESILYDFKRPVQTVAVDPEYNQNAKGRILSGGLAGKPTLSERGWLGNKETVLEGNEGPILESAWHGRLAAWANDAGVRVYDTLNMRMVGLVRRRPDSPRADLFRCRLLWQDSETLIIGWYTHITKVVIHEGVNKVLSLETTVNMKLDCIVSGLAMMQNNLLVLAYLADLGEAEDMRRGNAQRPELRIINDSFEEVSDDALGLKGYEKLLPNDYALVAHPTEKSFIVSSPEDIITARERDAEDHVRWLVENSKFEDALAACAGLPSPPTELSFAMIGSQYMDHLLQDKNFERAASLAPRVLLEDADAWEKQVFLFAEHDQLETLTPFIPVANPILSSTVYEMALGHYVKSNPEMLLDTIKRWPPEIYNTEDILSTIVYALSERGNTILTECMAELYLKTDRPREALPYFLALGKSESFDIIRQYHLFDAIQEDVLQLVTIDAPAADSDVKAGKLANSQAIDMLVQHTHSIPMHKVVAQLQTRPALLYCYFRAVLAYDASLASDFTDLQVKLYAEYDRERLMELLKNTTGYSLERAIEECERREYIPELVFILGKTGNSKRALQLIIEKLEDVSQAIAFATQQSDPDLWEDLVAYSLDKPPFIRGLLEAPGIAVDAVSLLRRVPKGLRIEGLKETLEKVFSDADLQLSLSTGGGNIHAAHAAALSRKLQQQQRRGTRMEPADVLTALGFNSLTEARPRSRRGQEDMFSLAREELFVFLDGVRRVPRLQLEEKRGEAGAIGRASAALPASGIRPARSRHKKQHQTMSAKMTLCAVNRNRLLEAVEQG
ncbi:hypothetical protein BCR37DRAFT_378907 [Protomyces lactucae-debilis]|uniref:Vps41 beta-propeller domain-containing protein n=1 Tax=Protomyces lactucae-debilis TaxID=2754530 RepID=A0A1Y2FKK4_PROLT|nr:uncharacterized protein BCR37DRAFT_378907 [Protomyces lactucae-debilis]ORY83894.1 hypothetical protein BCR37DRAFT_378907 [Protomyces lactucae-debilis]